MNCMPSNPICRRLAIALALSATLLLGGLAGPAMAADRPSAADLLPKETLVVLSVPDAVMVDSIGPRSTVPVRI